MTLRFFPDAAGRELGYAERTTSATTTNTTLGSTSAKISSLSVTVVGQGRPVDVEGFFPNSTVGSANVGYGFVLLQDNVNVGLAVGVSPSTAFGPGRIVKARRVLTAGVTYVFEVSIYTISGTLTVNGSAADPMFLSVVAR